MNGILVANRGEIAVRAIRAVHELGLRAVAVHPVDDRSSLHVRHADEAVELAGTGPAAYLDIAAIVAAAQRTGCYAIHPGYGFLSENADFARACVTAALTFIGPSPDGLTSSGTRPPPP